MSSSVSARKTTEVDARGNEVVATDYGRVDGTPQAVPGLLFMMHGR